MCNVNIATGEVIQFEFDVLLSGRIPWQLVRSYSSKNPQLGPIGFGWKLNLGTMLRRADNAFELIVDGAPVATLAIPAVGTRIADEASGFVVERTDTTIVVMDRVLTKYTFPYGDPLPTAMACTLLRDYYDNAIRYGYDGLGRLDTLIDTWGRHISFTYDSLSRLVEVSMPRSGSTTARWQFVRYEYDRQNDLVAARDPYGNATRYEYSSHLLTRVTDRCGRDLYYQYDRAGTCIRTWFTDGVWDRHLLFDPQLSRVLVTDPNGHAVLYKHNGKGIVIGEVDALGRVREDVVDNNGRLLLRTGSGGGLQTLIRRDSVTGNVVLSKNGVETTCEVDANDRVTMMKDHAGRVWRYAYDGAANETRSEEPTGAVWTFDYNERGDLVHAVDPVGHERFRARTATRLTLSDRWGIRRDEWFDEMGRPIKHGDSKGNAVTIEYDLCGHPVRRTNPNGTSVSVEYDPVGHPTSFTDELGHRLRALRDPARTWIRFLRPDGHEQLFAYDLRDQFTAITNATGNIARFSYDPAGRCTSITYYDGRQHVIVYDDANNPIALLDGRSARVLATCRYENTALVEEAYYDGRRLAVSYGPSTEVVSLDNDDSTLRYERDPQTRIVAAHADALTLNFDYSLRGDCTAVRVNSGRRIDYEWDGRERLVRMADSSAGEYHYSYDTRDLVTEIRMPNGCSQQFEYDNMDRMVFRRVTRADGTEVCARRFSYDGAGRLAGYQDSLRGARRFEYNPADFLTSVTDAGGVQQFLHDPNGNLLTTRDGAGITYGAGDRPTRVGSNELEYDERGNISVWRSERGEARYEYTGEGWLRRAVLPDGTRAEYQYDPLARRIAKTVNGRRTEYRWNGVHLLDERTDGKQVDYLFMPGSFFLAGVTYGDRHYSYVFDQLGTPTELIDDRSEIAWAADYSAYGEITALQANTVPQPFRFLGQYFDEELGWHYSRYRYYQPVIGRFTTPDPIGFAGGLNLYAYAPNPVNWVDPLGLAVAMANGTCEVLSKCSWGPNMMAEAKNKEKGITQRGCAPDLNNPCARPPDQKDYYLENCVPAANRSAVEQSLKDQGDSCKSKQVDHIKEVQCHQPTDDPNTCGNLTPLTQTVNASFGSQIRSCRNQLANDHGLTGTVQMTIVLVDVRKMTPDQKKRHAPCDPNDKPTCP